MTWRMAVTHRTGYHYSVPVRASYNEARMTPVDSGGQHTLQSRLDVLPAARPLRYVDYWGTVVHAFDVQTSHLELVVTATSVVETSAAPESDGGQVSWADLSAPPLRDRFTELLAPSHYVVLEPELAAVAGELSAVGPVEAGRQAAQWVHDQLGYQRGATEVGTTSAQARAIGLGVCQDYTHLALALLRQSGLPARYVSGYLHPSTVPEVGEPVTGESHAWVEYWAGGWHAVDPTSLVDVRDRHVVVARGRDYGDVRPLSGVYHGAPAQALGVTVQLTRLR